MVASALDHGDGAGIAHRKPLPGDAPEIAFAFDCAIKHGIADDDRFLRHDAGIGGRARDDAATRESLADVIVGVSFEFESHPAREPSTEALPGGTGELHADRIVGQPLVPISLGDLAGKHGADRAIGVLDGAFDPHRRTSIERALRLRDQPAVEDVMDLVILRLAVTDRHASRRLRLQEQPGEVEPLGLPVRDNLAPVEHLHLPDHFVEGAIAQYGHQLAHLLGDEEEIVDHVLGRAVEALAQHGILSGHANRAGIEVTYPHHDAASCDQGRRREAEFIGAEQRADHDIAARAHASVDLYGDAPAQSVGHQRLVCLGQADLPGRAGVFDRRQRRGAGAAFEAGDGYVIGARLGNPRRDGADADLGDELHGYEPLRIDVFEIEDQLRQVLDRIDVVVRWWRDQPDAGSRVPHLGDDLVDLVPGKLAPFAGLGALGHLDLHHVRVDEIFRRHAEAAGGDLLDGRAHGIAVRQRLEAIRLLAAFAGIGLPADAVHGDGERGMRFARDRAERHGARREAAHDALGRLDLLDRHRLAAVLLRRFELEKAADREQPL